MSADVVFLATGDVAAHRPDLGSMFAHVAPLLRQGDLTFGQLETCVSDRGERSVHAKLAMRCDPGLGAAVRDAGYNVMSFAGNHCLDWGRAAFHDTLDHMGTAGVALAGAGPSLTEARAPVILDVKGVKVAVLAVSSILPEGYWAEHDRPGCAPMRAYTHYEQIEHDQPGTPARIITTPHPGDLARLCEDIRAAKTKADVVALSIHWGIHLIPETLADYQRAVAKAAVAAGCDVILGHHPHILKAIEFIDGKPVVYSMGNFAIEQPQAWDAGITRSASFKQLMALNPHFDLATAYVLPPDTRLTFILKLVIRERTIAEVRFIPCRIGNDSAPHPLTSSDPAFVEVADYMRHITASQDIETAYEADGDEVVVRPAG